MLPGTTLEILVLSVLNTSSRTTALKAVTSVRCFYFVVCGKIKIRAMEINSFRLGNGTKILVVLIVVRKAGKTGVKICLSPTPVLVLLKRWIKLL